MVIDLEARQGDKGQDVDWIKTNEKLPEVGQKIEMTCKHWEVNWMGDFSDIYIVKGTFDEFGNFWDQEGPRLYDPMFWKPHQPERLNPEDHNEDKLDMVCDSLNTEYKND